MRSNQKFREMLDSKTAITQNVDDEEFNVPDVESIMQTNLGIVDLKHKCKKCFAYFSTRSHLRKHVSQVHKDSNGNGLNNSTCSTNSDSSNPQYRWKCSYCASRFRTRDLKNTHQKECRQLNTTIKESEFVDYNDFDNSGFHSDSDANNDDEIKYEVNTKYSEDNLPGVSDPSLRRNEKWKCRICSECFETLQSLQLHQSNHHPEAEHKLFPQVNIKQEKFDLEDFHLETENEKQEYDATLAQEVAGPRWKCKTCSLVYETREQLRSHRRSHTGVRKTQTSGGGWNCNYCSEVYTSRDKLRLHKLANHPKEKRERRCHNDETKNWGDVGRYECELCNKEFISKSKIRKHMDVHKNKDRPKRLCTICGLELCSTYNLNNHIRTVHGRERKFHCTLCDRRFSHSHHLKTHMNRHEGIRPFQCEQCVKSFFDKTTLREHIKSVHLNLKAYACRICLRTFNRSGNMRAHMLKTHNLGDLTGVQCQTDNNRGSGSRNANNEPSENEIEDFTPRFYPSHLGEPFRSIMKLSN